MNIPLPYDYDTATFDQEKALSHVFEYPAFKTALHNRPTALDLYITTGREIADLMAGSFHARQRYQAYKNNLQFYHKAALRMASRSAMIGLALFVLSLLPPLASFQLLVWSLLGIGACLFIALPMGLLVNISCKSSSRTEEYLKEIYELERSITELYTFVYVGDLQDEVCDLMNWDIDDSSAKSTALH